MYTLSSPSNSLKDCLSVILKNSMNSVDARTQPCLTPFAIERAERGRCCVELGRDGFVMLDDHGEELW